MRRSFSSLIVASIAALSACTDEPSSEDVERAIRVHHDKARVALSGFGMDKVNHHSISKIGCLPDGPSAFRCDVDVDSEGPAARIKRVVVVRVAKDSEGVWTVARWNYSGPYKDTKLNDLKKLLDSGALTQAEYDVESQRVMIQRY